MAPTALIILDGFGLAPPSPGNAVHLAHTPTFDQIYRISPHTQLLASGNAVGLPEGQMGNSEVGHLNLGAGRIVMQKQTYIQALIDEGAFFENPLLHRLCEIFESGKALHLMGLVSDGGVHSDLKHLYALLTLIQNYEKPTVFIHMFTDGRDVGPTTGINFARTLETHLSQISGVEIATVIGRYYAMDRDKRWERSQIAYEAIVCGEAELQARSATEAVEAAYERGETDEFIKPTVLVNEAGQPRGQIQDGDAVFFFNFRVDRARQLSYALVQETFDGFERSRLLKNLTYASMMMIDEALGTPFAFELPPIKNCLAEVLANAGKQQYHSAETEKYPHVTFFFNATREDPYPGEERMIVPSPKVATYDLQPEMSAPELTQATLARLRDHEDDFLLINYANPDMVGHTGIIPAAIAACEASDQGLGKILAAIREKGGRALVVADHGNCEVMIDKDGGPHTAHTTNLVPCILVDDHYHGRLREGGKLGDIAPTILELMGIPKPEEMTGVSLLRH